MRFPVQCCCQPGKRLGWFNHPRLEKAGDRVLIPIKRAGSPLVTELEPARTIRSEEVRVEVLERADRTRLLAINSHDRPLELWKQLPGFELDEGWLE